MKEPAAHSITGKEGEKRAQQYLLSKEYTILHTNWRSGHYELDIVAKKDEELVIVEVKTRTENYLLSPEEAISKSKIRRLIAATNAYVRYFRIDLHLRFDIITLIKKKDTYEIEHIEDAFRVPLNR